MEVDHNRTTRPRGFSSPVTLDTTTPAPGKDPSPPPPPPENSTLSPTPSDTVPTYDLPSNSRKLAALNVTLRRSTTPQTDYAKLSMSKEALLLRSGVTLRRHARESFTSLSSYMSQVEGEGEGEARQRKNSEEGTSDEDDALEPINKLVVMTTPVHACTCRHLVSHRNCVKVTSHF